MNKLHGRVFLALIVLLVAGWLGFQTGPQSAYAAPALGITPTPTEPPTDTPTPTATPTTTPTPATPTATPVPGPEISPTPPAPTPAATLILPVAGRANPMPFWLWLVVGSALFVSGTYLLSRRKS